METYLKSIGTCPDCGKSLFRDLRTNDLRVCLFDGRDHKKYCKKSRETEAHKKAINGPDSGQMELF
jgi:hypothetical protein